MSGSSSKSNKAELSLLFLYIFVCVDKSYLLAIFLTLLAFSSLSLRLFAEDGDVDIESHLFTVSILFSGNSFVMPCIILLKTMTQLYGWIAKITIWHIAESMIVFSKRPTQFGKKPIDKIIRHINWQAFLFSVSPSSTLRYLVCSV